MGIDLVRLGWPNTAVILALAMLPMFAFTLAPASDAKVATVAADTFDVAMTDVPSAIE